MRTVYQTSAGALVLAALAPTLLARDGPAAGPVLTIHHINVGKGDSELIVSPTGTTFLIDAGVDGMGHKAVVPYLKRLGITHLDYINASHYDRDHIGGIDEVIEAGYMPSVVYDRGEYYLLPEHPEYVDYKEAVAPVRQTIAVDQVIDLGGGVTARCIAVNGELTGGAYYDITSLFDFQNAASVCFEITYGSFSYLAMGDLHYAVENQLGPLIGDVDALKASHHGGNTGTHPTFAAAVTPEVSFFSIGGRSTFPSQSTIQNLSPATGMTWIYQTGVSSSGAVGSLVADGNVVLTTDGTTYTVTGDGMVPRTFLCDELVGSAPAAGEVAVSEVLPHPLAVADADGEYVELTNLTGRALSMQDWTITSGAESVHVRSRALLGPRETLAIAANGFRRFNGGLAAAAVWPDGSIALADGDGVALQAGPLQVDAIAWTAGQVAPGFSLERRDLYQPAAGNLSTTAHAFGDGDHGTPGAPNATDATPWTPILVEVCPGTGSAQGGELVVISGFDLATDAAPLVLFEGLPATEVTVVDACTLTARTPSAGPGAADVVLTNANGSGLIAGGFVYQ
jgi:competence protein ComEC